MTPSLHSSASSASLNGLDALVMPLFAEPNFTNDHTLRLPNGIQYLCKIYDESNNEITLTPEMRQSIIQIFVKATKEYEDLRKNISDANVKLNSLSIGYPDRSNTILTTVINHVSKRYIIKNDKQEPKGYSARPVRASRVYRDDKEEDAAPKTASTKKLSPAPVVLTSHEKERKAKDDDGPSASNPTAPFTVPAQKPHDAAVASSSASPPSGVILSSHEDKEKVAEATVPANKPVSVQLKPVKPKKAKKSASKAKRKKISKSMEEIAELQKSLAEKINELSKISLNSLNARQAAVLNLGNELLKIDMQIKVFSQAIGQNPSPANKQAVIDLRLGLEALAAGLLKNSGNEDLIKQLNEKSSEQIDWENIRDKVNEVVQKQVATKES
jgi:hypothetical protein